MFLLCNSPQILDDSDKVSTSRNTRAKRRLFRAASKRRINKALIGGPTNFVHCQHVDDSLSLNSESFNTKSWTARSGQLQRKPSDASQSSSSKSSPQDSTVCSSPPSPTRARPTSFQVSPRRKPVPAIDDIIKTDSEDEVVVPAVVAEETSEEKDPESAPPDDTVL